MTPCANCRTLKPSGGKPCPNPNCEPPKCPTCGYRPWHDRAVCPECGPDAVAANALADEGYCPECRHHVGYAELWTNRDIYGYRECDGCVEHLGFVAGGEA